MLHVCICGSTVPEASEQQQMLPQLKVEGRVFAQWWCRVKRVAKSQPGMVTMVLSAIIIAMHHAECECFILEGFVNCSKVYPV